MPELDPNKKFPKPGEIPGQTQIHQGQPGLEHVMVPPPDYEHVPAPTSFSTEPSLETYRGSDKLKDRIALITGGDSGIGRSVATLFAKEGASGIAIVYKKNEQKDALETEKAIKKEGKECLLLPKDIRSEETCKQIIDETVAKFGRIDILVNNAAVQYITEKIEDISTEQLKETFETNIYAMFWLTKYAVAHMAPGSSIINTTSVVAYKGSPSLLDYSASKGAIVSFTRSLSIHLAPRGIRVNAVAPGPIWTPLQPVSRTEENVEKWQGKAPLLGRIGQPSEVGTSFVFLASPMESSYFTGQCLHPNGGYIVNT